VSKTIIVAGRVLRQLRGDKRLLALSIVAPLAIVYCLKLFFDTMPPMFPIARYVVPVAAFLVHFLAFLLCAIVLVRERAQGTLERMFINGFTRTDVIAGYLLGYLGLATLQALAALTEVVLLFSLDYSATIFVELFIEWCGCLPLHPLCWGFSSRRLLETKGRCFLLFRWSSCRRCSFPDC
jgi:ABC-2 type transport system permease protein